MDSPSPRPWSPAVAGAAALLVFLGTALLMTRSAWLGGPNALLGGGEQPDWTGTMWAYWWTGTALTHGLDPFHATWNFVPVGQAPVSQYNLLDALLAWPLLRLLGPVAGYDAAAVLFLATTGLGGYLLGRAAGVAPAAAVLTGLAVETANYTTVELTQGRLTQALLLPFLLALATLFRLSRGEGGLRLALASGLWVTATALTYWYYGFFVVLGALPLWLATVRSWDRHCLRRLGLSAALCGLACGPLVLRLARAYPALPGVGRTVEPWMGFEAPEGTSYHLAMASRHGEWLGWPLAVDGSGEIDRSVAVVVLVLAGLGLFRRGWPRWRWLAVALLGYVLALGPYAVGYDGHPTAVPLPFLALHEAIPFFERLWWPARAIPLVYAGLGVLAALGVEALASDRAWRRRALALLAAAALLAELAWRSHSFLVPSGTPRRYDPDFYGQLDGTLLTLPVMSPEPFGRHVLWMQVNHGHPVLGGLGDFVPGHSPPAFAAWVQSNALLRALYQVSNGIAAAVTVTPADVDALLEAGFTWAVMDPETLQHKRDGAWAAAYRSVLDPVFGRPAVAWQRAAAWRIEPLADEVSLPAIPAVSPGIGKTSPAARSRGAAPSPTSAPKRAP